MSDVSVSQSLSSKLQVITQSIIVIIHNKPVIQNKKPPETVSFPAALPVSFHGIGTVCRKADILPEVINEDYPSPYVKPLLAHILEGIGSVGTSPMASSFPAIRYKTWLFVPLPMRV